SCLTVLTLFIAHLLVGGRRFKFCHSESMKLPVWLQDGNKEAEVVLISEILAVTPCGNWSYEQNPHLLLTKPVKLM
ncbi:MAG: hypothetical protein RDU01_01010, partial [Thermodesulfovibrionales bacterium]|nr:hypothetical protein [Thermodesulfovibrionales bacterium]